MTRGTGLALYGAACFGLLEFCNWLDGAGWRFYVFSAPGFAFASVLIAGLVLRAFDAVRRSDAAGPTWEDCPGCPYQRMKGSMCLKCGDVEKKRTKPLSLRERRAAEEMLNDLIAQGVARRLTLEELDRRLL
jgi:hypothetical protein